VVSLLLDGRNADFHGHCKQLKRQLFIYDITDISQIQWSSRRSDQSRHIGLVLAGTHYLSVLLIC